jgi:hypothetical protein
MASICILVTCDESRNISKGSTHAIQLSAAAVNPYARKSRTAYQQGCATWMRLYTCMPLYSAGAVELLRFCFRKYWHLDVAALVNADGSLAQANESGDCLTTQTGAD